MEARTTLRSVQAALHDHVLGRASTIADELREGGRISTAQRLAIYHHAYRARLLDVMRDSFEKTWAYLGDERFDAAAGAFIEANPPCHRNLRWYGDSFVAWLGERFPADIDISELAMVDWGLRNAFDGDDASPVAAAAFERLHASDWAHIGCRFAPTLTIASVNYNTAAIWHALDRDEPPPPARRLGEPKWLMIWRSGWQPHFRTIGADEYAVLSRLQAGRPVAAVCAEFAAQPAGENAAVTVASYVRTWVDAEMIVELTGLSQ